MVEDENLLARLLALPALLSTPDVSWLPSPNRVDLLVHYGGAPAHLVRTAFAVVIVDDQDVLMAYNRRRGIEYPGGHIEDGETPLEAAMRESREEVGVVPIGLRPFLLQRMLSQGSVPDGWRYPHPVGFQQFHVGRTSAAGLVGYVENDECLAPVRLPIVDALSSDSALTPSQKVILQAALSTLKYC